MAGGINKTTSMQVGRHIRRVAQAGAGAVAAFVLISACGGGGGAGNTDTPSTAIATPPSTIVTPSAIPTVFPSGFSSPGVGGADIPADFPIPPDAKVEAAPMPGMKALRLTGVSADEAFVFYRDALPAAGYSIVTDVTGDKSLERFLGFTGHGVLGALGGGRTPQGEDILLLTFHELN